MTSSASRSGPAFLNVTVPANDRNQPSSATSFANSASPLKQWNTVRSGAPTRRSVSHDLLVRVAVVDLQREVVLLRDRDVRLEGAHLRGAPRVVGGAVEVEPGLADGAHPRPSREFGDAGEVLVERAGDLELGRLVRVQRDGREHARLVGGELGAPARGRQIGAHLHDAAHADARRAVELLARLEGFDAVLDLEVRVVVVDRDDERLRQRRVLRGGVGLRIPLAGPHEVGRGVRHAAPEASSGVSSMRGKSPSIAVVVGAGGQQPPGAGGTHRLRA